MQEKMYVLNSRVHSRKRYDLVYYPHCVETREIYTEITFQRRTGPVFCLAVGVSSDYAQPITGQVTEVTSPVIGWAQPELTQSKRQKTGPGHLSSPYITFFVLIYDIPILQFSSLIDRIQHELMA